MECREAIKLVRDHIGTLYISEIDTINALRKFAIPAMEKEIEKDVAVKTSVAHWNRSYYACPNEDCNEFIKWRYDIHADNHHDLNYRPDRCPFCGQSLRWR